MPRIFRSASSGRGVNVVGMFRAELGIGESGRSMARALLRAGEPVALLDFSAVSTHRKGDRTFSRFARAPVHPITLLCANPPEYQQFAQSKMARAFGESRYRIGSWWWELPDLPAAWREAFAAVDELWVGSRFIYDCIAPLSPVPVAYVPPIVEPPPVAPLDLAAFGVSPGEMTVLVMFDYRSVWQRKNPDGAVEAFRRAFRGGERVRLVLKTINADFAPDAVARLRDAIGGDKRISLVDRYLSREGVYGLVRAADVYLSLHRSEGFGLTIAEALAYGRPVVVTDWSGNVDFTTPANSFLVDSTLRTLSADFGPYQRGSRWAEPDPDHAAAQLRRIYADPARAQARALRGRLDVRRHFSTVRVARMVADRLAAIRAEAVAV